VPLPVSLGWRDRRGFFVARSEGTEVSEVKNCLVQRSPVGVLMLIEEFFEAVDRAFSEEAGRIPAPRRLESKTPVGLPVSALESSPSTPSIAWRRQPKRCRQLVQNRQEEGQREDRCVQCETFSLMRRSFDYLPFCCNLYVPQAFRSPPHRGLVSLPSPSRRVTARKPLAVRRAPLSEGVELHRFFFQG
jgi:hypothetical protein